jgi:ABC-type branched-subunit amino acid transport system ATPase component
VAHGEPPTNPEEHAFAVFPEVKNLLARQGMHLSGGRMPRRSAPTEKRRRAHSR